MPSGGSCRGPEWPQAAAPAPHPRLRPARHPGRPGHLPGLPSAPELPDPFRDQLGLDAALQRDHLGLDLAVELGDLLANTGSDQLAGLTARSLQVAVPIRDVVPGTARDASLCGFAVAVVASVGPAPLLDLRRFSRYSIFGETGSGSAIPSVDEEMYVGCGPVSSTSSASAIDRRAKLLAAA